MEPNDFRDFGNDKTGVVEKLGSMAHVQFKKGTTQLFFKTDHAHTVSNNHFLNQRKRPVVRMCGCADVRISVGNELISKTAPGQYFEFAPLNFLKLHY